MGWWGPLLPEETHLGAPPTEPGHQVPSPPPLRPLLALLLPGGGGVDARLPAAPQLLLHHPACDGPLLGLGEAAAPRPLGGAAAPGPRQAAVHGGLRQLVQPVQGHRQALEVPGGCGGGGAPAPPPLPPLHRGTGPLGGSGGAEERRSG